MKDNQELALKESNLIMGRTLNRLKDKMMNMEIELSQQAITIEVLRQELAELRKEG